MADTRPSRRFWHRRPRTTRALALGAIFLVAFGSGFAYAAWTLVCRSGACPDPRQLDAYTPDQTSKVYAADGRFVAELGLQRRTLVKLDRIPKIVQDAFIVTEDKRFYEHSGIDWTRVVGAALHDIAARGYAQGFSTITMQLARNIFPEQITRVKTLTRKLREAKVATEIEALYPKSKILELYLNQISLGGGAYGVETASQRYFGKSVRDLNIAEAATLAGLPKAPERYNPRRFPERAIQRRNTVIELMRQAGVITDAQAQLAKAYPMRLANKVQAGEVAPYFVEWIRQQLERRFGERLYTDGLKIYTTLDIDMQLAAERSLEHQLDAIEGGKYGAYHHETYEEFVAGNGSGEHDVTPHSSYLQGAFVAIDPRTGAVRAMIGGRDFNASEFNRATDALRQPGSTFKPFVYADAIHNGLPPSYLLADTALSVPQLNGPDWSPQNFDHKYLGMMPLRRAFYLSRNVATIRLGMQLGEPSVIGMARRFGITTPIPPYPSINIGSASVYPLEMIAAYSTFANLGTRTDPFGIVRVEDAKGDTLWTPTPVQHDVLSPDEAWLMVNMMEDVVRRGTAARVWASGFHIPAGGKTGTTNDGTDVWFIGYTPDLVAGVWMGFDRPQKIQANAQGGHLAAPAWTRFMTDFYHGRTPPAEWRQPADIVTRQVDESTGMLRNPFCPDSVVATEYYLPGTEPTQECNVHTPFNTGPNADTTASRSPLTPGRRGAKKQPVIPDPFKIP